MQLRTIKLQKEKCPQLIKDKQENQLKSQTAKLRTQINYSKGGRNVRIDHGINIRQAPENPLWRNHIKTKSKDQICRN